MITWSSVLNQNYFAFFNKKTILFLNLVLDCVEVAYASRKFWGQFFSVFMPLALNISGHPICGLGDLWTCRRWMQTPNARWKRRGLNRPLGLIEWLEKTWARQRRSDAIVLFPVKQDYPVFGPPSRNKKTDPRCLQQRKKFTINAREISKYHSARLEMIILSQTNSFHRLLIDKICWSFRNSLASCWEK